MREGDYIWHGGVLCAVHALGSTTVVAVTYGIAGGNVATRDTQHCFVADGEGEISYDAQLIMVDNVREADDGKVYVAGDELLVVRAAQSATASGGEAAVASHRWTIRVRPTFRAQASRITPVSLQHTKRCRGGRTTATS